MEELEKKIYEIIGRVGKAKLCEYLDFVAHTLRSRLKKGGWTYEEVLKIENAVVDKNGVIQDKRDLLFNAKN